jgi:ABC-type polysaccharide/polyol phosphate export permease
LVLLLQIVFVCGAALLCSALDVYYRDVRYVVESTNLVLFWLVPIFYGFEDIPADYAWFYQLNPIAAVILITRRILLEGSSPEFGTLVKLALVSVVTLVVGYFTFRSIQKDFSDYL